MSNVHILGDTWSAQQVLVDVMGENPDGPICIAYRTKEKINGKYEWRTVIGGDADGPTVLMASELLRARAIKWIDE